MSRAVACDKKDCPFSLSELYQGWGPICNHTGGPEIDSKGKCRYMETIGHTIESNHENISNSRCPWCGAKTVINDNGMQWCISSVCDWSRK